VIAVFSRRFLSAFAAFIILPGMVAFYLPWLLHSRQTPLHALGIPLMAVGIVLLLWCVRDFYVAGKGTLAPWDPPRRLVAVGLYRISRNPMYVAVVTILCGWATAYPSRTLWIYAAVIAVSFHLRVILFEEPWLAETHGEQWTAYRGSVPRWLIGRRIRYDGSAPTGGT
jgi:protein-S-isoprenylcysteine O-methyltransferase Ste14